MAEKMKAVILSKDKEKTTKKPPTVSQETDSLKTNNLDVTEEKNHKSDTKRRVILLLVKVGFFIALCYVVFFVLFGISRMRDNGMYPAVRDGDLLIYYRMENNFNNGDVVVVDKDGEERVMRIIASPGQELDIDEENGLTVDGQPSLFQAFYDTGRAESYAFRYPYKVSNDCYFMMNDYRSNTNDSRAFGEVCKDKIKGRLISKIQVRDI